MFIYKPIYFKCFIDFKRLNSIKHDWNAEVNVIFLIAVHTGGTELVSLKLESKRLGGNLQISGLRSVLLDVASNFRQMFLMCSSNGGLTCAGLD